MQIHKLIFRGLPPVLAASLLITACGEPPPAETVIRPVRYIVVESAGGQRTRTFSGVARAGVESALSFRVPGTIVRLGVGVGDAVEQGDPLAGLDPVDYESQLREAQAALRQAEAQAGNARADLRRVRNLYENDNASRTELDAAMAAADSTAAQAESVTQRLDLVRRQVGYTRLVAPASGVIANVLAEVNENVSAGQTVVVLASVGSPEIGFAVPEALIGQLSEGLPATAAFDAIPGRRFAGRVTEVGVSSAATGTTFPVTVRIGEAAPEIRSGMAAGVDIALGDASAPDRFVLPAQAVGEDRVGRFVFVAEPTAEGRAVARRRPVTVGALLPGGLEVTEGIDAGDRVIVAGLNRLRDGQPVRIGEPDQGPG